MRLRIKSSTLIISVIILLGGIILGICLSPKEEEVSKENTASDFVKEKYKDIKVQDMTRVMSDLEDGYFDEIVPNAVSSRLIDIADILECKGNIKDTVNTTEYITQLYENNVLFVYNKDDNVFIVEKIDLEEQCSNLDELPSKKYRSTLYTFSNNVIKLVETNIGERFMNYDAKGLKKFLKEDYGNIYEGIDKELKKFKLSKDATYTGFIDNNSVVITEIKDNVELKRFIITKRANGLISKEEDLTKSTDKGSKENTELESTESESTELESTESESTESESIEHKTSENEINETDNLVID